LKQQEAKKILWITLVLNFAVSGAKLLVGLLTRSASMTADGFHSFSDGTSNIIGLIGLSVSSKPVDETHPYGHQKFETIASLGVGVLLLLVSLDIIKGAIDRLMHPVTPDVTLISFVVMLATMAVNIGVMTYEFREGKRLKSDFLVSDSLHTRADIFVSLSVIIALICVDLGYPIFDPIISLFIALLIIYSAYEIFISAFKVLSDAEIVSASAIEKIVRGFPEVLNCHKIRARGREDCIFIDLHIWVKPNMTIEESHKLNHLIEEAIKLKVPGVKEVIIHTEPAARSK
jgi:cation diffusion facilitator family transporter